jgi:hypothetical protein
MKTYFVIALLGFCSGCARIVTDIGSVSISAEEIRALEADLSRDERSLETLQMGTPDCLMACNLAANICSLSRRICRVAVELAGDAKAQGSCDDGKARCEKAQKRVNDSCTCALKPAPLTP